MATEEDFRRLDEEAEIEAAAAAGGFGMDGKGKMPSMEEIMQFIEQSSGLSDQEKADIKEDIIKYNAEKNEALGGNILTSTAAAGGILATQNLIFIGLVLFVAFIIGFFVYKLIKTEKDKERAKELKRLAREQRRTKRKKT